MTGRRSRPVSPARGRWGKGWVCTRLKAVLPSVQPCPSQRNGTLQPPPCRLPGRRPVLQAFAGTRPCHPSPPRPHVPSPAPAATSPTHPTPATPWPPPPPRTHLVEQQDDLLVGVGGADVALHVRATTGQRVARVQHLEGGRGGVEGGGCVCGGCGGCGLEAEELVCMCPHPKSRARQNNRQASHRPEAHPARPRAPPRFRFPPFC